MTVWDAIVLACALALVIEGVMKGAIRLAFGLAGLVAGYLYAGYVAERAAVHMSFLAPHLRRPVAVVVGFILIVALFTLVGALVSKLAKETGLGCLNRVLGAVLGAVVGIYLSAGLVRIAGRFSPGLQEKMNRGPVVRLMQELAVGMETLLPHHPEGAPMEPVPAAPAPPAPKSTPAPGPKPAEPEAPPQKAPPPAASPRPKGDMT